MRIDSILEIYNLISKSTQNIESRREGMALRKSGIDSSFSPSSGIVKFAFDTRRIDQETQINPRRGLQNYHRSEAFVTEAMSQKLKNFSKLRSALNELKDVYGKEREWQDSNARVLLSTLDKGLRTIEKDGDYSEAQPSVGSLDYIEELMHVRYRLSFDDMTRLSVSDLKKAILSKDPELTSKDINKEEVEITKRDVAKESYDTLLEKLFGGVKATSDGKTVERTVTITIRDSVVDDQK